MANINPVLDLVDEFGSLSAPSGAAQGQGQGTPPVSNRPSGDSLNSLVFKSSHREDLLQRDIAKAIKLIQQTELKGLIAGTKVFFDNLYYDKARDMITGQIEICTYAMDNSQDDSSFKAGRNNYKNRIVFNLGEANGIENRFVDPDRGIDKRLTAKEQLEVLRNFVNKISAATQKMEDKRAAPFRSFQKMEQTFMPNLEKMEGLCLLDQTPEYNRKGSSLDGKDEFRDSCIKKVKAWNKEMAANGEEYRMRFGDGEVTKNPTYWEMVIPETLAKGIDKWTSWAPKWVKNLVPANIRDHLPDFVNKVLDYNIHIKLGVTDHPGGLIKRDSNGVPQLTVFGATKYHTSKDAKMQQMYKDIAHAAGLLAGFQTYDIQKYKISNKNNKTDHFGYEVDSKGKRVQYEPVGFWKRVFTFFSDDARSSHVTSMKLEKDDDLCRLQIFSGKQISDWKWFKRYVTDFSYWNRKENRSFMELALGEHRHDSMRQTALEMFRLADAFAVDHRTALPGKRLWSTSGFMQQILTACAPKRPENEIYNGHKYTRPKSLGILNIHFSKLQDVTWLRGNFGLHWLGSDVACGESVIMGNFDQATFTRCRIGNSLFDWVKGIFTGHGLRGMKSAIGFCGGYSDKINENTSASGVVFEDTSVLANTTFYGSIKSGAFKPRFLSFDHFSANCTEMNEFGINPTGMFLPSFRFAFSNFNAEKQAGLSEILKSGLIGTPYVWHRFWMHNAKEVHDLILRENAIKRAMSERLFYVHIAEWVPNSIRGAGFRLCFPASAAIIEGKPGFNNGNVEIMFYNSAVRKPIANCGREAGYIRVVADDLDVPDKNWIREFDRVSAMELLLKATPFMAAPTSVDQFGRLSDN